MIEHTELYDNILRSVPPRGRSGNHQKQRAPRGGVRRAKHYNSSSPAPLYYYSLITLSLRPRTQNYNTYHTHTYVYIYI